MRFYINLDDTKSINGLPRWLSSQQSAYQHMSPRKCRFDPWVGKIPRRRKWQPTPVFFPGKFHGQRSLVGYSPWGPKESDMTECLHFTHFILYHWRRKWQPTPVFFPGESHGQGSLAGCGPWGRRKSDTTEVTKQGAIAN